jgi:hypothetical protein
MNLLLFCIANIVIAFASLEAARIKREENMEFEGCPQSYPNPFDNGQVK